MPTPVAKPRHTIGMNTVVVAVGRQPIAQLFIAILCIVLAIAVANILFGFSRATSALLQSGLVILAVHAAYTFYVRTFERRSLIELERQAAIPDLVRGFVGGLLLVCVVLLGLSVTGAFSIESWHGFRGFINALVIAATAAYVEEVLFRGVMFRILEQTLGTWLSLLLSGAMFGMMHLGNPEASTWAAVAVGLEAGVLLTAVYVLTRRLWPVIGVHLGWNFAQGGIFGISVSGTASTGLLSSAVAGAEWWTGGRFGIEASALAVALCLIVAAVLLHKASRRHRIMAPSWKRRRPATQTGFPHPNSSAAEGVRSSA